MSKHNYFILFLLAAFVGGSGATAHAQGSGLTCELRAPTISCSVRTDILRVESISVNRGRCADMLVIGGDKLFAGGNARNFNPTAAPLGPFEVKFGDLVMITAVPCNIIEWTIGAGGRQWTWTVR